MNKKKIILVLIAIVGVIALGIYLGHPHNYTETVLSGSTCTTEGTRQSKCWCGDTYEKTLDILGHDYVSEVTQDTTCTEKGISIYMLSL